MKEIVGAKIIGELRVRMDKEAADKKCSLSELIRQKIIFAYEQEDKEKTIMDCFMYRKLIGGDIAVEALKDYMRQPSPNIHLLIEYARIDRVEGLIRPYIEALL